MAYIDTDAIIKAESMIHIACVNIHDLKTAYITNTMVHQETHLDSIITSRPSQSVYELWTIVYCLCILRNVATSTALYADLIDTTSEEFELAILLYQDNTEMFRAKLRDTLYVELDTLVNLVVALKPTNFRG